MACGYHINTEAGLITITGTDTTAVSEFQDLAERLLSDPTFDPMLAQLLDFRGLELDYRQADREQIHDYMLNIYSPQIKANSAIVVDGNQNSKVIARMFQLACGMDKTELFDDYNQALRWLMRKEFANSIAD